MTLDEIGVIYLKNINIALIKIALGLELKSIFNVIQ